MRPTLCPGSIVNVRILGQQHTGAVVLEADERTQYPYDGVRIAHGGEAFWVGADQLELVDVDALPMEQHSEEQP